MDTYRKVILKKALAKVSNSLHEVETLDSVFGRIRASVEEGKK